MYLSLKVHEPTPVSGDFNQLDYARSIIRGEAAALAQVALRLDDSFLHAIDLLHRCAGRVGITGTGKSADIGQKIAGTLNSTGTRAYVLDATRAVHGDLGMVHPNDVILVLSYSGESEEIVRVLTPLQRQASALIAITGNRRSRLARAANVTLWLGDLAEVCPLGLAPSTSATATMAVGDALAFVLSRLRNFSHEDFARLHPAGNLGRKLLKVEDVMRRGSDLRIASGDDTVREVFAQVRMGGRRTGAIMLTDRQGRLSGLFTDSDLARLFEHRRDDSFDRPIREVMTVAPITVVQGCRVLDAVDILRSRKISELPVIDAEGQPVGLIDITDLIGLVPMEESETAAAAVA